MSHSNVMLPLATVAMAVGAGLAGWYAGERQGAERAAAEVAAASPAPATAGAAATTAGAAATTTATASSPTAARTAHPEKWPLTAPDPSTIPEGPLGDAVRRGQAIVTRTYEEVPDHVGNGLHCTSCHLQGGTVANAGPWIGITGVFPEYRSRNAKVNVLEDRVNDCFERSMNGKALPTDSDDMRAIVAYMTWLSDGVPVGVPIEGRGFARIQEPPTPDPERGKAIYAEKCVACHGDDGAGRTGPDNTYVFPALWGDRSYNLGAGMARLDTAAAFVKWNMPLGQGGSLTDQEAYDVAAYFIAQPRPDFAKKAQDWPNGGKPRDARY